LDYVRKQIQRDLDDTDNKALLVRLLKNIRRYLATREQADYNVRGMIATTNDTLITLKKLECRANRGTLKRKQFWTLTMAQALIAVIMTKYSHKRWLKYKLAHIVESLPHNWLQLYSKPPPSTVYYMFSTSTKMDYLGESNSWRTRFFSEITDANKLSSMLKHNDHPKYQAEISFRKKRYPYSIRVMQRQGIEHWITIPVRDLSEFNHPDSATLIRKRYEKHLIRCLNPRMNTKGMQPRNYNKTKTHQRKRPPIAIRKARKTCPTHHIPLNKCPHSCWISQRENPTKTLTKYTIQNKTTTTTTTTLTLDVFIQKQKPNQKLKP
jgi:hypothetical protein